MCLFRQIYSNRLQQEIKMPYQQGNRLPGERASRLGHLEVLKSDLVNKLIESFETRTTSETQVDASWAALPPVDQELNLIFGIDGSLQKIEYETPPFKALAFVKTALLRLDQVALSKIDKASPNPFAVRDILSDAALYHATVFPLRNVHIEGVSNYNAIRKIIFQSIKDLEGEPFETLKWLAYEKWDGTNKGLPLFECPSCEQTIATLNYDSEEGDCPNCGEHLYLTDMLGFHQVMTTDSAPDGVASDYMGVHETLLLFTGIRHYWETNRELLNNCLFVKDGPLSIRAQYSKLVAPIRRFFQFALSKNVEVHVVGQEKSGAFFDHFELISMNCPSNSIFLPSNQYVRERIQQRSVRGAPYGKDTNYGAKVFLKLDEYTKMVLMIPTKGFVPDPALSDLIGAPRILSTIPKILSSQHEGGLLPIQLAHGIASLSTYPSAKILSMFAAR